MDNELIVKHEDIERPVVRDKAHVLTYGNPLLRRRASEVTLIKPSTMPLIDLMSRVLRRMNALGLAAPQIGVSERIIVVNTLKDCVAIINPEIASISEETQISEEGCLSIPGASCSIERARDVVVRGRDADLNPVMHEWTGVLAAVVQHEIEHLDGVLMVDHCGQARRNVELRKMRNMMQKLRIPATGYYVDLREIKA